MSAEEDLPKQSTEQRPYFSCKKINNSTFLIVEDDILEARPFIYAKICKEEGILVLSDTGSGGGSTGTSRSLRVLLETLPVPENNHLPLNPCREDGRTALDYLIICTHCHWDHILGIPQWLQDAQDSEAGGRRSSPTIVASELGKTFVESDLPTHSGCEELDLLTPRYTVSHWAADLDWIVQGKIRILQTPGHTPDELAWYDAEERHLYVGDSFNDRLPDDGSYEEPISFGEDSSLIDFMQSLAKMQEFVAKENAISGKQPVKIGCGHATSSKDAASTIAEVQDFFWSVLKGKTPVKESSEEDGDTSDLYQEDGQPRFAVDVPRVLVERARDHFRSIGKL